MKLTQKEIGMLRNEYYYEMFNLETRLDEVRKVQCFDEDLLQEQITRIECSLRECKCRDLMLKSLEDEES